MNTSQSISNKFLNEKYRWVWHVLFWIYIYLDEFFSILGLTPPLEEPVLNFYGFLLDMAVVYFNLYVLVPKFLLKEKLLQYILFTICSLLIILVFNVYAYEYDISDEYFFSSSLSTLLHNSFMLGLAVAVKLLSVIYKNRLSYEQLSTEKLKTELGFLKNQVNPHFLFNTLNSFYVQAKKKDDRLPDALLNLADLLRYQIYDTQKDFVPLDGEMNYIKNYLDLEKTRRDNLEISIDYNNDNSNVKISPLLILPIVENAVKYSQRTDGGLCKIHVQSNVIDDKVSFTINNTKGRVSEIKSPDSGIGLDNVRKRLNLAYPNDFVIDINDGDDMYTINLIVGKR